MVASFVSVNLQMPLQLTDEALFPHEFRVFLRVENHLAVFRHAPHVAQLSEQGQDVRFRIKGH